MEHLLLAFYFVSILFCTGMVFLAVLLFLKYRHDLFKYLAYLSAGCFSYAAGQIFFFYSKSTVNYFEAAAGLVQSVFVALSSIIIVYSVPLIAHSALNKAMARTTTVIHRVFVGLYALTAIVLLCMHKNAIYLIIIDLCQGIVCFYAMILLTANYHSRKSDDEKSVLRTILIICYVIVPLILVKRRLLVFFVLPEIMRQLPFPEIFLFFGVSITLLYYSARFFFISSSTVEALLTESNIEKYNITSREHEVIDCLLRGYTSNYIANRLCISQKTVKNHIYHIYQKLGVRSRLEMFHALKA